MLSSSKQSACASNILCTSVGLKRCATVAFYTHPPNKQNEAWTEASKRGDVHAFGLSSSFVASVNRQGASNCAIMSGTNMFGVALFIWQMASTTHDTFPSHLI